MYSDFSPSTFEILIQVYSSYSKRLPKVAVLLNQWHFNRCGVASMYLLMSVL